MTLLIDTHAFLLLVTADKRLSKRAKRVFLDQGNRLLLSVASAWEISIKAAKGRLTLPDSPRSWLRQELAKNRVEVLPITFEHATRVFALKSTNQDPFDRLIAAQALEESVPLLSADSVFDDYGVERVWS
jgi:PIN domain nuclease of toxin-antitoxin system